jgi:rhodanese-related sulfurtransferase/DNA-binding CsgD family transcriptional regulator
MANRSAKRELFDQFAQVGKAVSSPARLELLDLLAQGEKTVELLARQAGLSVTNTSNHLKALRMAGLVTAVKDGQFVHYNLAHPDVAVFLRALQSIAQERLASVREIAKRYLDEPESLQPVGARELVELIRADEVIVLDVRPGDEYASAHIPGAISIPVDELAGRLAELDPEKEVVAYCRGPYCVFAPRAVEILQAHGFRARRLSEGVPDWRALGLEVAVGAPSGGSLS